MKLVEPTLDLKNSYLEMLEEWDKFENHSEQSPFPLSYDVSNFEAFLNKMNGQKSVAENGFVCNTTFWLVDENKKIYGVSNLRHKLNDRLMHTGGHIGYGIRPDERRKGYATKILELTLLEAKKIGITKILVTCTANNIGSNKTITNNEGILFETSMVDEKKYNKYWIPNV